MNLPKVSKNRLRAAEPLGPRTGFHIGGKAQYWYEPRDRRELSRFLKSCDPAPPLFVIGAGTNLLIREGLIKRLFIHLAEGEFNEIKIEGTEVEVGAGVRIGRLISVLSSKDLGGYEFLAGIPGTIGGALAMNAGARSDFSDSGTYREMKDIVAGVDALDRRGYSVGLKRDDLKFSYRDSNLRSYIILRCRLNLRKADKDRVRRRIKENILQRLRHQDWEYPSAGSFFKNPGQGKPAGRLIDRCALKGLRVGGAQVSEKHANFIINRDRARSDDVIKLMEIVKRRVYNQFNVDLTPEVEIVS